MRGKAGKKGERGGKRKKRRGKKRTGGGIRVKLISSIDSNIKN